MTRPPTKNMDPRSQLKAVKRVLEGAEEPPIEDFDESYNRRGGDDDAGGAIAMPPGCPVEPLGTENNLFYFLTALGELRALAADKVANKHIVGMFAPLTGYLFDTWPRKKLVVVTDENGEPELDAAGVKVREWIVTGWAADDVSMQLMRVAAARGVWNAQERVRGRGAWRDEDGRLILHCGNQVLVNGTWQKPGRFDEFVYPTAPPIPRPSPKAATGAAAADLLTMLRTWNWARPSIDPILLLGWIVSGMMGGALDHRPVTWITGDKATGKTALQRLIGGVYDGALLQSSNATEAAVRQILGQQSLPVSIDEAEAEEDNRKMLALVNLARQAATGGRILRGGQDHQGHEFIARCCFQFSSILVPPLPPQDRSRIGVLELGPLPAGGREPKLSAAEMRAIGAALRRRFADAWGRWPRILEMFRDALIDFGGHSSRGADVFATMLAAAHVVMEDDAPDDRELAEWGRMLHVGTLAELADDQSEAQRCLHFLGSTLVQLSGHGTPRLVSDWVQQAIGVDQEAQGKAKETLAKIGLGIFVGKIRSADSDKPQPVPGRRYLGVASVHQGLAQQFEGSHWKGKSGAAGVWSQALGRIVGAVRNEKQRFGGVLQACTLVPIGAVTGDDMPADATVAAEEREDA